jgi:hypothetical protein
MVFLPMVFLPVLLLPVLSMLGPRVRRSPDRGCAPAQPGPGSSSGRWAHSRLTLIAAPG